MVSTAMAAAVTPGAIVESPSPNPFKSADFRTWAVTLGYT